MSLKERLTNYAALAKMHLTRVSNCLLNGCRLAEKGGGKASDPAHGILPAAEWRARINHRAMAEGPTVLMEPHPPVGSAPGSHITFLGTGVPAHGALNMARRPVDPSRLLRFTLNTGGIE